MRIGVAGGRGFIGAHLVRALGAEVIGREGPSGNYDAIVWAAGRRSNDPAELSAEHVDAPLAARAHCGRFVYLSSAEVYGPGPVPFREDQPVLPRSPYAQAKRRAEEHLAESSAVLRLAIVYGAGQGGTMLLPSLLAALRAGRRFPMSPGAQTRDFVHVDDVVAAVRAALDAVGIFNVGSGMETRVADAALALARLLGGESLLGIGDLPYRADEQMRYVLDLAKARAALAWAPQVTLAQGLARLVAS